MSRLIVVSNRVNPPVGKGEESVGGLAMALAAALREYSGIWFGWSGKTTETFTGQLNMQKVEGVTVATVDLEEGDYQEYYNGYANKTLWPLFHYRVDLTAYDRSFGEGYDRVNKRFAETLLPLIEPDDIIWVHDYHLIPMARELRRLGVTNRIGFFLHIPWPAHQLVVTLPRHRPLVEAAERLARSSELVLQRGDMVAELRTPGQDKGKSVAAFLREAPFEGATPVFVGDDLTDEDGFAAAARLGGYGVLVGPMRPTAASYRLPSTEAVTARLESVVTLAPA